MPKRKLIIKKTKCYSAMRYETLKPEELEYDNTRDYCNCLRQVCRPKRMYMMNLIHSNRLPPKIGYDISMKYKDKMSTLLDIALDLDEKSYVRMLKKVGIKTFDCLMKTDIIFAAKWGNYNAVKNLIEKNVELDKLDINGFSAMNYAIKHNSYQILDLLLKAGANFYVLQKEEDLEIPLIANLVLNSKKECLKVAIKNGLPILNFLVDFNCERKEVDIRIKLLIECGLNINRKIIFRINQNEKIKGNALILAIYLNNNNIIKNLLDNGIDPHYTVETEGVFKGCNSLHIAGFYGNTKAIEQILNYSKMNINCLTIHNCNVLTIAATQCRINTVKYLLKKGIHVFHKMNNGRDILHILDSKIKIVSDNLEEYSPHVNIDKLKEVREMIQNRGIIYILTVTQKKIRDWWLKQKERIEEKENIKKEKAKLRKKKKKKRRAEKKKKMKLEEEEEEKRKKLEIEDIKRMKIHEENIRLRNKYTITRAISLTNKVLYTCKNCITKRHSEEEMRRHVKVCNIIPYKSDISMLEEAEKIDRCFIEIDGFKTVGRVNSP